MSGDSKRAPSLRLAVSVASGVVLIAPVAAVVAWNAATTPGFLDGEVLRPVMVSVAAYGGLAITFAIALGRWAVAPLLRLVSDIDRLDSSRLTNRPGEPAEMYDIRLSIRRRLARSEIAARKAREASATILHDLKAPVLGIRNVLRLIQLEESWDASARDLLLVRLSKETEALSEQVVAGVDVLRLLGDEELGPQSEVDVRVLVDEAVQRVTVPEKSVSVLGRAHAVCDVSLTSRALFNLIDNAVRHARSAVLIEIHPGLVRICDDGSGLPASLDELVVPFRRGGRGSQSGVGGLGLAMAKRALEAHGGSLKVERTDGHGTVLLAYLGHQFERLATRG